MADTENEKSPLERLNDKLYSPNAPTREFNETLHPLPVETPRSWTPPPAPLPIRPKMPWTTRFLIGAGIFLLLAGSTAAFIVLRGTRAISTDHISIQTTGPSILGSGDTVSLLVTVENKNPTAIQSTVLTADLPDGSRRVEDPSQPFDHYTDSLGEIPAGEARTRTIAVKLFGEKGQTLSIPLRVEYRTQGSNALFTKEGEYSVTVSSAPVIVDVAAVSETASGQPLMLSVSVRSNTATTLKNVGVQMAPVTGFIPGASTPTPTGTGFFALGDLAPGEQKSIQVRGTLSGQAGEERVFSFAAGSRKGDGTIGIDIPYASGGALVRIASPFLGTSISLNGSSADTLSVAAGTSINGILSWTNTLPTPITDAVLTLTVSGNALATGSVSSPNAFYRSSDSSLIFSSTADAGLARLESNDHGAQPFQLGVKSAEALKGVRNPTITLTLSVAGTRIGEKNVPQSVTATMKRVIQVSTDASVVSSLSRANAPYPNTGALPPAPNTETTYTVQLRAQSSVNTVGGTRVSMTLPDYVRYTGKAASMVAYNESTRMVTWTVGDVTPGASPTAQFQIAFTPSASQSGTEPVLVGVQTLTGKDRFTQNDVTTTAPALTTASLSPGVGSGQSVVSK